MKFCRIPSHGQKVADLSQKVGVGERLAASQAYPLRAEFPLVVMVVFPGIRVSTKTSQG